MTHTDFFEDGVVSAIKDAMTGIAKRYNEKPKMLLVPGEESIDKGITTIFGMRVIQTPLVRSPLVGVMLVECPWCMGNCLNIMCPRCRGTGIASFAM